MATCRECAYLRKCIDKATKEGYEHNVDFDPKDGCPGWGFKSKADAETNADRIRAMSDDELASWAKKQIGCGAGFFPCGVVCNGKCEAYSPEACRTLIMKWLKQPAEVTDNAR